MTSHIRKLYSDFLYSKLYNDGIAEFISSDCAKKMIKKYYNDDTTTSNAFKILANYRTK